MKKTKKSAKAKKNSTRKKKSVDPRAQRTGVLDPIFQRLLKRGMVIDRRKPR